MIDYTSIKLLAKQHGTKVNDLLALAPTNDPFYTGFPRKLEAERWFTGLWQQFGYSNGIHLRRVYYQVVCQKPLITRPDGKLFEELEAVEVDIDEHPLPEPEISGDPVDVLYSSDRDCIEKIQAYWGRRNHSGEMQP